MTFLFQDELPPLSFEPDEKALAQAKYQAALRGGLGLIDREPLGRAGQGAINTYLGAHEDARRQQLAQQQILMQRMKMAEDIRNRQAVQNFLGGLTPQQRKQYGISEAAYQGMLAVQDPGMALEAMKPRTTKEGDVVTVGNQPFITRAKDGVTPLMVDGQEVGATPVVGYAELKAQQLAAAERAKTEAVNKADYFTKPVEVEIGGRKTKMTMAQYDQIIGRQPPAAQGATQPSGFSWKG